VVPRQSVPYLSASVIELAHKEALCQVSSVFTYLATYKRGSLGVKLIAGADGELLQRGCDRWRCMQVRGRETSITSRQAIDLPSQRRSALTD